MESAAKDSESESISMQVPNAAALPSQSQRNPEKIPAITPKKKPGNPGSSQVDAGPASQERLAAVNQGGTTVNQEGSVSQEGTPKKRQGDTPKTKTAGRQPKKESGGKGGKEGEIQTE